MNIIVADDHWLAIDALSRLLTGAAPDITVQTAGDFYQAHDILAAPHEVSLALLDYEMPGMNGLEGLRRLRELDKPPPIAIISSHQERALILAALQAGAAGFIPKHLPGTAIYHAVRLMLAGCRFIPEEALGTDQAASTAPEDAIQQLSQREEEVLQAVADGLSNKQVAYALEISEVTVKMHMQRIFRKMNVSNRVQAVTKFKNSPPNTGALFERVRAAFPVDESEALEKRFLASVRELAAQIEVEMQSGDLPSLGKAAHTLKGLAQEFSADQLARVADHLEICARNGTAPQAAYASLLDSLRRLPKG